MNHNINIWVYNKIIHIKPPLEEPIKKISNIGDHIFILTYSNILYEGTPLEIDDQYYLKLTTVNSSIKPIDIESCKDTLYFITNEGNVLVCNEQLDVLNEISLIEEYKCPQGHSGLKYRVKVKSISVSDYGKLYVSEHDELWGSGYMPQIGIYSDIPKKIEFFYNRIIYNVCVGADFAIVVSSRSKSNDLETVSDDVPPVCQICSSISESLSGTLSTDYCPLGVKLNESSGSNNGESLNCQKRDDNLIVYNENNFSIKDERMKEEHNIIFRNIEAAKDFLTRQISRMSLVGEQYLMECTKNPTHLNEQNMTNATFVFENVETVDDERASLSHHMSSSSDYTTGTENNNEQLLHKKHSHEDLMLSSSQSNSEKDVSEMEVLEHVDVILQKGLDLLNRDLWIWGNIKLGCLGNAEIKKDVPVIISSLSNIGVSKISLQHHHACAITLDGRAFLWGQNDHHQVCLENNEDQFKPKLFASNGGERVSDAICGKCFTIILSSKTELTYFGKDSSSYQVIYHNFLSENGTIQEQPMKQYNNLVNSMEYSLLNIGMKSDESFSNFLIKEQTILEEMLAVNQHVIQILSKRTITSENHALYSSLYKCYIDMLYFLAASVESLIEHKNNVRVLNDVIILKHFKEFLLVYKNYFDIIQDIVSINGFIHISKLIPLSTFLCSLKSEIPKDSNSSDKDISTLFLSPVERTSVYSEFFIQFSNVELFVKWKEFMDYMDVKKNDAEKTSNFWLNSGKNLVHLIKPRRRLICDSTSVPITLQSSSRFSNHRFILFSDIFVHVNGSTSHLHPLSMLWLELIHHDTLHLISLKTPEVILILAAPDGVSKNYWYHALQQAINAALNKTELYPPPLIRSGTYTFNKASFFKDATYVGRWSNAKMHGWGKLRWSDGRTYTGKFNSNFLAGYGVMEMPTIGTYKGNWKENQQNGYGTLRYINKDFYKGYFRDGLPHGHGLLRKGNFMTNSASLYIGEWVLGKKSGYGVMDEISRGEKYLGCWSEGKKEGSGIIVTSEGTYYEGYFQNDMLSGQGIMVLEDGTFYEGEFKGTGIVAGKGTLTLLSGYVINGILTGSLEEGIRISTGIISKRREEHSELPKSFGKLCTSPSQKWNALFKRCYDVLGLSEQGTASLDTSRIWQNVAVYLAGASTLKRDKGIDNGLHNSLNNLDVIPPFGRDIITMESYTEIRNYLKRAFESPFHPLGSILNDLSEAYISSYSGKMHPILLNHAILEIVDLTQRMYDIIRHLFPALPTRDFDYIINNNDDKFDVISYQSLLYPVILPKVYNCLFTLLSLRNEVQEKQYKKILIEWNKMTDRGLMSFFSVEKKFLNLDQCITLSDKSHAFVEAIEMLQQIITVFLPVEKLGLIRNTVEKMTPVAQELLGNTYVWNMDDLFPLFLYVVVRARIPHLGAELEFIENFMDRHLENGELGIMFTTLKACYQQILQDKSFDN